MEHIFDNQPNGNAARKGCRAAMSMALAWPLSCIKPLQNSAMVILQHQVECFHKATECFIQIVIDMCEIAGAWQRVLMIFRAVAGSALSCQLLCD